MSRPILNFHQDPIDVYEIKGYEVIAGTETIRQSGGSWPDWSEDNPKRYSMSVSLLYQFREDSMSGFEVMDGNRSANQMDAADSFEKIPSDILYSIKSVV